MSEPFDVAAGDWLSLRVGGGNFHVGVRLIDGDDRIVHVLTGRQDATLRERKFDLSPFAGNQLRLEIFDESDHRWGHVMADEIVLHRSD
jgi:hypothetical protein